jgi:hypothetical protein
MEDILKYENRDQLYQFLIEDFGLVKVEEHYDGKAFGNFYIILSSEDFLLSYVNDRSFLDIEIASKLEPTNAIALSFVKNFLYHPNDINPEESEINNVKRIEYLNNFLKKDISKIRFLFNLDNY